MAFFSKFIQEFMDLFTLKLIPFQVEKVNSNIKKEETGPLYLSASDNEEDLHPRKRPKNLHGSGSSWDYDSREYNHLPGSGVGRLCDGSVYIPLKVENGKVNSNELDYDWLEREQEEQRIRRVELRNPQAQAAVERANNIPRINLEQDNIGLEGLASRGPTKDEIATVVDSLGPNLEAEFLWEKHIEILNYQQEVLEAEERGEELLIPDFEKYPKLLWTDYNPDYKNFVTKEVSDPNAPWYDPKNPLFDANFSEKVSDPNSPFYDPNNSLFDENIFKDQGKDQGEDVGKGKGKAKES